MPNLKAKRHELLALYPRTTENLAVATPVNSRNELILIYLQPNTPDIAYRNWDEYDRWTEKSDAAWRSHAAPPPEPENFAHIYASNVHYMMHSNGMEREDRLLLEVGVKNTKGAPLSKKVAHLTWIERNPSPELKNLAAEFHHNMIEWLRSRGYYFITLVPTSDALAKYWKRLGYAPLDDFGPEKVPLIVRNSDKVSGLHILPLSGSDDAYLIALRGK